MKYVIFIFSLVALLLLSACSTQPVVNEPKSVLPAASQGEAPAEAGTVEYILFITGDEFSPNVMTANQGDTLRITVANGQEVDGKEKQHHCGYNGQNDECHHQPGAQFGAHHLAPAVIKQFYQVSEYQINQQDEQQQVDVDQDKHQDGVGDRYTGAKTDDARFGKCQQGHHHKDDHNDNPFAAAADAVGIPGGFFFALCHGTAYHL